MAFGSHKKNTHDLYGFHAVREAWLNEERTIHKLLITEQALRGFEDTLQKAQEMGLQRPKPKKIDKSKLDKALPRGAVHQGIAVLCNPLEEHDVQDFIIQSKSQSRTVLAMLDQVTDPHNVGAIMRSASAFGVDGVILQKKHAPVLSGVLAKTACGAVDHLPVATTTNLSRCVKELQEDGFFVIGLDEHGVRNLKDVALTRHYPEHVSKGDPLAPYQDQDENEKIVIVLGSEGDGIRRLIKETCDALAHLPTHGAIASLNVSNAAAIAFYAFARKRT